MNPRGVVWMRWSVATAAVVVLLPISNASARQEELPEGVTPAIVDEGQELFAGPAVCATCHGLTGEGSPLAPNLTDDEWLNIDGTYDAIIELINSGVPEPNEYPTPMLPKGGSEITDEQVRAVAAYVWTLSRASSDT